MLRIFNKKLRTKGSITVEACLTLPVFLTVFFLLLSFAKFTCTGMVLDYAVNETAKEIAASSYPIALMNEIEDEKIQEYGDAAMPPPEEELERLGQQIGNTGYGNILNAIVSEGFNGADAIEVLENLLEDYHKGILEDAAGRITAEYWKMKSAGKYLIADALIREHLDYPIIDKNNARLRLAEFPQSKSEYSSKSASTVYESFGLIPGQDFGIDDVVLQLEYDYRMNLPFVKPINIKMVHTAVERAWTKGSFGILTVEEEGLELEADDSIIFITRTGIRYHKGSCWHLRKSRIPIDLKEAEARGYTPCKVCKPSKSGG